MDNGLMRELEQTRELAERQELRGLDTVTMRYGLSLSEADIAEITERHSETLHDTGRVEFGGGIASKLAYAFCDSPYITAQDYKETLLALQDAFYYFKGEALETLSDDELIELMRTIFDGAAQGDIDYLCGTTLEELCRNTRFGFGPVYEDTTITEVYDDE